MFFFFLVDTVSKQTFLCYILYIEQWGFCIMCKTISKVPPILDTLNRHVSTTNYVTCYFCYMFRLGSSSGNMDSVRIGILVDSEIVLSTRYGKTSVLSSESERLEPVPVRPETDR
jgi:hypothetical protein